MIEARDMNEQDVEYLLEENTEFVRQINELRKLLSTCWDLVPDGPFADHERGLKAIDVKNGMTRYQCWPHDYDR